RCQTGSQLASRARQSYGAPFASPSGPAVAHQTRGRQGETPVKDWTDMTNKRRRRDAANDASEGSEPTLRPINNDQPTAKAVDWTQRAQQAADDKAAQEVQEKERTDYDGRNYIFLIGGAGLVGV